MVVSANLVVWSGPRQVEVGQVAPVGQCDAGAAGWQGRGQGRGHRGVLHAGGELLAVDDPGEQAAPGGRAQQSARRGAAVHLDGVDLQEPLVELVHEVVHERQQQQVGARRVRLKVAGRPGQERLEHVVLARQPARPWQRRTWSIAVLP